MRVAARAVETPKSRSMSRRVRRVRSSFSSWLMASGMARSHRGLGGILDPGQPVAFVQVGTIQSAHVFRHVSRRFYRMQDPGPFLRGSHKGGYGTVRKGESNQSRQEGPTARKTGGQGARRLSVDQAEDVDRVAASAPGGAAPGAHWGPRSRPVFSDQAVRADGGSCGAGPQEVHPTCTFRALLTCRLVVLYTKS